MDIVTLATYSEAVQAELAKMFLESEGVSCFIADGNAGSMNFYGGVSVGVRIQVYENDLGRARELLNQFEVEKKGEIDEEALLAAFEQDAAERKVPISENPISELSSIQESDKDFSTDSCSESEPTCPKCGSPRLAKERDFSFGLLLISFLLLGLPLLFIKPKLICKRCGYTLE